MLELKAKIVQLLNESGLPIDAIVILTKDIHRDALEAYNEYKQMQIAEAAKASAETQKEEQNDN